MNETIYDNRNRFNRDILKLLAEYLEKHDGIRFIQALENIGIIERYSSGDVKDAYYEEPSITFERMKREMDN